MSFQTSTPLEEITLEQLLGEAVGAASTAWLNPQQTVGEFYKDPTPGEFRLVPDRVFDVELALSIVETVKAFIEEHYWLRTTELEQAQEAQR